LVDINHTFQLTDLPVIGQRPAPFYTASARTRRNMH
jgi:hypothetical protein